MIESYASFLMQIIREQRKECRYKNLVFYFLAFNVRYARTLNVFLAKTMHVLFLLIVENVLVISSASHSRNRVPCACFDDA